MPNILSTIYKKELLDIVPKKAIIQYQISEQISKASDTTSLIELELPGQLINNSYYLSEQNLNLEGSSCVIKLISFNISSESDEFKIRLLNINDITKLNTINEIISIDSIQYSCMISVSEMDIIVKNNDSPQTNKLYMYVYNTSTFIDIDNINVELIYEIIKNSDI